MELTTDRGGVGEAGDAGIARRAGAEIVTSDAAPAREQARGSGENVGRAERVVSLLAGGALAIFGVRRRDLPGVALALAGAELVRRGATGHCLVYQSMGVSTADRRRYPRHRPGEVVSEAATVDARQAIKVDRSVVVQREPHELYALWRRFEELPRYMPHLTEVRDEGDGRSHWVAEVDGELVEWDAAIVNDIPGKLLAWKTVGHPDIAHAGSVHFRAAAGGGTELQVVVDYEPPVGDIADRLMHALGRSPEQLLERELRLFKSMVENHQRAD